MLVAPPSMTPQEQRLYTERCTPGAPRAAAAAPAAAWDVQLASLLTAFVPPATVLIVDWKALDAVSSVRWQPLPPQETSMPMRDTNHFVRSGQTDLGGRALLLTATGAKGAVLNVYIEDQIPQANRGDVLQALQRSGFRVQRVRCGRVYQLSAADWYRLTKPGFHPVILRSGKRCDTTSCPRAQETHMLALGGVLPPLQPGEVDVVAGQCPGR